MTGLRKDCSSGTYTKFTTISHGKQNRKQPLPYGCEHKNFPNISELYLWINKNHSTYSRSPPQIKQTTLLEIHATKQINQFRSGTKNDVAFVKPGRISVSRINILMVCVRVSVPLFKISDKSSIITIATKKIHFIAVFFCRDGGKEHFVNCVEATTDFSF